MDVSESAVRPVDFNRDSKFLGDLHIVPDLSQCDEGVRDDDSLAFGERNPRPVLVGLVRPTQLLRVEHVNSVHMHELVSLIYVSSNFTSELPCKSGLSRARGSSYKDQFVGSVRHTTQDTRTCQLSQLKS